MAGKLPETILPSRADTTARKDIGAFRKWKEWAVGYGMEAIPAKEFRFTLYLQHLASTSKSRSAVEEACNSLIWVHSTAGLLSPVSFPFVCATKEGLQRILAKPVVKKSPVTVDVLAAIAEDANCSGALKDLTLATGCLLHVFCRLPSLQ